MSATTMALKPYIEHLMQPHIKNIESISILKTIIELLEIPLDQNCSAYTMVAFG